MTQPYFPAAVFAAPNHVPRVVIAPGRYIQGPGVLDHLGRYLSLISAQHALLLISPGGQKRVGSRLTGSLQDHQVTATTELFEGECSYEQVEAITKKIKQLDSPPDCLVAVGGGKCIDAGKGIAYRSGIPIVVCPTIASTDAPTSAVAVMYREDGVALGGEFYRESPAIVVVDSDMIARAPARYLAAGIADALASVYEVRANVNNPKGRSMVGGRPSRTIQILTEGLRDVIFQDGAAAVEAVKQNKVTPALENIIEMNTLGSGIGFESGGLAVVHAVAKGLTAIDRVRLNYLHGEQVAIGILTQLLLLEEREEAQRVVDLFQTIGLPTHLGEIGLDATDLSDVIEMAMDTPFIQRIGEIKGGSLTAEKLQTAIHAMHVFGVKQGEAA